MDDGPVVLGLNRTQDASACLLHGSRLGWAIQKERLTRHKHHRGRPGDVRGLYRERLPGLDRPIEMLVEASFRRMPLHALAMPPFWIRKRIEPELRE